MAVLSILRRTMGRKLHKNDEWLEGFNAGMMAILVRVRGDIQSLIDKYSEKPIKCMLVKCDGKGDSPEDIDAGINEFYGYGPDPLTAKDKERIRGQLDGSTD